MGIINQSLSQAPHASVEKAHCTCLVLDSVLHCLFTLVGLGTTPTCCSPHALQLSFYMLFVLDESEKRTARPIGIYGSFKEKNKKHSSARQGPKLICFSVQSYFSKSPVLQDILLEA